MLCFWNVINALSYARNYFIFERDDYPGGVWIGFLSCSACYFLWAVLSPAIFRLERRYPLGSNSWAANPIVPTISRFPRRQRPLSSADFCKGAD